MSNDQEEVAADLVHVPSPTPSATELIGESFKTSGKSVDNRPLPGAHVDSVIEKFRAERLAGNGPKDEDAPAAEAEAGDDLEPSVLGVVDDDAPTTPDADIKAKEAAPLAEEHAATIERYDELFRQVEAERDGIKAQRERLDAYEHLETEIRVSPGQAFSDFVRRVVGDDINAHREMLSDAITELTALSLDVKLDTDTRVRQLDRKVKENEARSKRQQVKLADDERERAYQQEVSTSRQMVANAIGSLTNQYPYLLAEEDAAQLIVSLGEKEYKQTGKSRDWNTIANSLNKDLETKHVAKLSRLEKLKGPKSAPQNTTSEIKSDTAKSAPRTLGTRAASEPAAMPSEQTRAPNFESHVEQVMKEFAQKRRMTTT